LVNRNKVNVLIYIYIDTHFVEMQRLAKILSERIPCNIFYYFEYSYPEIQKDIKLARESGHYILNHAGDFQYDYTGLQEKNNFKKSFLFNLRIRAIQYTINKLKKPLNWLSSSFFILSLLYLNKFKIVRKILKNSNPDILVLPEVNIAYITDFLIKECIQQNIPTVVVPFTMANSQEIAEAYINNEDYRVHKLLDYFVSIFFRKWVLRYKSKNLIPLRSTEILIKEIFNLAPSLPWIINSGDINALAVESPRMFEYYLNSGLPIKQLSLTGSIADDALFKAASDEELRKKIFLQHNFDFDLPLVLCSLPPDQIRSGRTVPEFSDYRALVDFWIISLMQLQGINLLIKLHPRMSLDSHPFIKEYGCAVSDLDTTSLISLCDFYVASVSSTIRWAIASGKPVINYDVYRYNYDDYKSARGVLYCDTGVDFLELLLRFTTDPNYFSSICSIQRLDAKNWGYLDGRSGDRIAKLLLSFLP
jgi:hypothetical protein